MRITSSIAEIRELVGNAKRLGKRVGFVPTMGALHAGHLALIDRAVEECDTTVVSIFVNPLQFGPTEDFDRYPRTFEADAELCRQHGVDAIFAPSAEEMYPEGHKTVVDVLDLTEGLCGAYRPGHFRGVTTVVAKLFQIVAPDRAYFGQKDYQQLLAIRRMVADLHFPLEVVPVETVREPDGLAISSRNQYLSPGERQAATVIYRSLMEARRLLAAGERHPGKVREAVRAVLATEPMFREQYVEVVNAADLRPLEPPGTAPGANPGAQSQPQVLVAVAGFIGETRLIDNIVFPGLGGEQ